MQIMIVHHTQGFISNDASWMKFCSMITMSSMHTFEHWNWSRLSRPFRMINNIFVDDLPYFDCIPTVHLYCTHCITTTTRAMFCPFAPSPSISVIAYISTLLTTLLFCCTWYHILIVFFTLLFLPFSPSQAISAVLYPGDKVSTLLFSSILYNFVPSYVYVAQYCRENRLCHKQRDWKACAWLSKCKQ